jgi:hypothetical protein
MELSILTVSFRSPEDTLRCLESLESGGAEGVDWEMLVGDNGSGDIEALATLQGHPRVRLLPGTENLGFGRENNRLAVAAEGEFLLCLNPDTIVHPGTLAGLVRHLRNDSGCGACSPRLLNPDGSRQFSWNRNMGLAWETAEAFYLQNLWRARQERNQLKALPDGPWTVDFASGACLCIRKGAWERVGGFDPDFFMNHEDIDLCHRLCCDGWTVQVLPGLSIVHFDSGTQKKDWTGFVHNRLSSKWIALPKLHTGTALAIARALWFLGAGLRLTLSSLRSDPEGRQRRRGYLRAILERASFR